MTTMCQGHTLGDNPEFLVQKMVFPALAFGSKPGGLESKETNLPPAQQLLIFLFSTHQAPGA